MNLTVIGMIAVIALVASAASLYLLYVAKVEAEELLAKKQGEIDAAIAAAMEGAAARIDVLAAGLRTQFEEDVAAKAVELAASVNAELLTVLADREATLRAELQAMVDKAIAGLQVALAQGVRP